MPLDYSKWDALELSDDSDIEVHPNVDKKSFIRAKQNQIHHERHLRKQRIMALKYEIALHKALLERITDLVASLNSKLKASSGTTDPGQLAFEAVMESAAKHTNDVLPEVPEGLSVSPNQPKTYSGMMAGLVDQVKKALDEKKTEPEGRFAAMLEEIGVHERQVRTLIRESGEELAKLEMEESKKITSESIHTGFDSSHVNKSTSAGGESTKVELLNPGYGGSSDDAASKSKDGDDDDEEIEPSPAAKKFADIAANNYAASLEFVSKNPQILTERETDGLLVLAFNAALAGDLDRCKQCVHQGLLLQYCRSLGRDGVALFFRRIAPGKIGGGSDSNSGGSSKAKEVFYNDVQDTYTRIRTRAEELNAKQSDLGVEQIQLQAVEPGTVISIRVPPADSDNPETQEARKIYEQFSDEMKAALETGQLDKVNEVLGNLKVDEAEEMVHLFGEANILSLEEEIIDSTTEEGQQQIKDLQAKVAAEREAEMTETETETEPEMDERRDLLGDPE